MKLGLLAMGALAVIGASFAPTGNAAGDCSSVEIIDVGGLAYWVLVGDSIDEAWGYIETNGEDSVQRGGTAWHGGADPCQQSNPDLVFY